jgi:chromosome segregation ATPase
MSEERLERIENQLSQVLEVVVRLDNRMTNLEDGMTGLDNRMTNLENRMTNLENRMTNLENRMTGLENRTEVVEGTLLATMRGGFNFIRGHVNDLDVDLARNERKSEDSARQIRRLNRRLMHLEGRTDEDPDNI